VRFGAVQGGLGGYGVEWRFCARTLRVLCLLWRCGKASLLLRSLKLAGRLMGVGGRGALRCGDESEVGDGYNYDVVVVVW